MSEDGVSDEVRYTAEELRGIRVKYSTIVIYVSQIYRLLVTLFFTLIATRKLPVNQYGLWATISGLLNLLIMAHWIWCSWSMRFYARKRHEMVSAAFLMSLAYIPVSIAILIAVGYAYSRVLGWGFTAFLIGALMLVSEAFNQFTRSISLGSKPYIEGKAIVVNVTVRLAAVYALVALIPGGVDGVVAATVLGSAAMVLARMALFRRYGVTLNVRRVGLTPVIRLLKNTYISSLSYVSTLLINVERPLVTAITSSTHLTAFLGVAYVPRNIIVRSSSAFTSGLTSKLLRVPSRRDIEDVLRLTLIVNIGVTALIAMLARPILSVFRETYTAAWPLFTLATIESFFYTLSAFFGSVAVSAERADLRKYGLALRKTPIFKYPLANLIRCVAVLGAGTAGLITLLLVKGPSAGVALVMPYPLAWAVSSVPLMAYTYRLAKGKVEFRVPRRELVASLLGCGIMMAAVAGMGLERFIIRNFWSQAPLLLGEAVVALLTYVAVVLAASPWLRSFIRSSLARAVPPLRRG